MLFRYKRLGLELTDTLLKIAEVHQTREKVLVQHLVAHPLPSVWFKDGELVESEALIHSLREALQEGSLSTRKVHIAINSRQAKVYRRRIPLMSQRKTKAWIKENLLQTLSLSEQECLFDFICLEKDELKEEQEIVVIVAVKSYIDHLLHTIEQCGLEPVSIDVTSLALYRYLQFVEETLPREFLSLHFSATGVEISSFRDQHVLDLSLISLPTSSFREGVDHPQTDALKPILLTNKEIAAFAQALWEQINPVLEKWNQEYTWQAGHWFLTGEGVDFQLLQEALKQYTSATLVCVAEPKEILSSTLQETGSRWIGSSMSVPIGITLSGREKS